MDGKSLISSLAVGMSILMQSQKYLYFWVLKMENILPETGVFWVG